VELVCPLHKDERVDLSALTPVFVRDKSDLKELSIPLDELKELPPLFEAIPPDHPKLPRKGEVIQAKTSEGWRIVRV